MYYVYILKSITRNTYYVGCTSNLKKRLSQHNRDQTYGIRHKGPWTLLMYRTFTNRYEAYDYEKKVKSYKGGNAFKKILNGEVAEWFKAAVC